MTHDIRKALIERMKAVLPYAENEARGLAAHEDCEQEEAEAWRLIEQAQAAIDQTEAEIAHATRAPQPLPIKYDDTLLPFLALMRKELNANAGKGDREGWLAMTPGECLLEIYYHQGKLQKAVKDHDRFGIREFAADVANMAMMLVDICGLLTCSAKGCVNLQPEDVRYGGMCANCAEGEDQELEMAAKHGTIDAQDKRLCQDEGCPHQGTDHVCVTPVPRLAPERYREVQAGKATLTDEERAAGWFFDDEYDGLLANRAWPGHEGH